MPKRPGAPVEPTAIDDGLIEKFRPDGTGFIERWIYTDEMGFSRSVARGERLNDVAAKAEARATAAAKNEIYRAKQGDRRRAEVYAHALPEQQREAAAWLGAVLNGGKTKTGLNGTGR